MKDQYSFPSFTFEDSLIARLLQRGGGVANDVQRRQFPKACAGKVFDHAFEWFDGVVLFLMRSGADSDLIEILVVEDLNEAAGKAEEQFQIFTIGGIFG